MSVQVDVTIPSDGAQGAPSTEAAPAARGGAPSDLPDVTDLRVVAPLVTVAVLAGLALVPVVRWFGRWTFPRANGSTGRSFTWRDVGAVALVFLGMQPVVGVALHALGLDPESLLVALNATIVVQGAACAAVLAAAARRPHGFAALGMRRGDHGWALGYGLVRYVGAGPFLFALMAMTPFLLERVVGVPHAPQDVARLIAGAEGGTRVLVLLYAAVLIPLLEELLFRGFLQNALEPRLGRVGAIALSSLAFAALHGASAFLPILGLSVLLGLVMLHTRRLTACWFVHGAHNGLTTALLFLFPDTLLGP